MTNWENCYTSFPWHKQRRAYSLRCHRQGDVPRTPITGGPLTKTGICDAVAVVLIFFDDSEEAKNEIFKVLKAAGGNPSPTKSGIESQSSLREMARTLPSTSYPQVASGLLALCEELLQNDADVEAACSSANENLGLWKKIKRLFQRLIFKK